MEKVTAGKLYYTITEVSSLTDLKPHILRYWETEFSVLRPKKNRAGNRAYREKDIQFIRLIKKLLYEEGYTIEGAKRKLKQLKSAIDEEPEEDNDLHRALRLVREIRAEARSALMLIEPDSK